MELTVGSILEGKVKSITNFGAFVALPDNKTGMVHISEVSNKFIKDIRANCHVMMQYYESHLSFFTTSIELL